MEDEIPPFVPPSGGLLPPTRPPEAAPQQAPQTQQAPQAQQALQAPQAPQAPLTSSAVSPYGPPPQSAALAPPPPSHAPVPPAPPRPRLNRQSVIGIVAGSAAILLIVGGALGASALVLQTMGPGRAAHPGSSGSAPAAGPSTAHPGGVVSSAVASQPLRCTKTCFANDFLVPGDTVPPPGAITALGLTKTVDSLGDYDASTASDEYDQTLSGWNDAHASPSRCFFTYFQSPVVATVGVRPDRDITEIDYSGTHTDPAKNNTLTQSVRIFANSADAEAHMRQLAASVRACPQYRTTDTGDTIDVDVSPAEAFPDFPRSEAAVGWTESSDGGRYDSVDIQRGNLVVRTSLQSFDGGVTEEQFRSFVADDAWQIAAMLTPGEGH